MAKGEISWTRRTPEGEKLRVYVHHVGDQWLFYWRTARYQQWQLVAEPPLEDWLELLDAVQRLIVRRRQRPEEEEHVRRLILQRFPGTHLP
jgi:hypothetical protein